MVPTTHLGFIGGLGMGEILVIGIVALLVFGRRLPDVARQVGKGVSEFRRGMAGVEHQVRDQAYTPLLSSTAPAPRDAQPELAPEPAASAPPPTPSDSPSTMGSA